MTSKLILLLVIFAAALGVIYVGYGQKQNAAPMIKVSAPSPVSSGLKTFQSKTMKFTISVPPNFDIKSTDITVSIKSKGEEIQIVSNGTQFSNVDSYLSDFDKKRNSIIKSGANLFIDHNNAVKRIETPKSANQEELVYYIFVEPSVYILSTSSPALYSDLDQIAQSFRYTP